MKLRLGLAGYRMAGGQLKAKPFGCGIASPSLDLPA